MSVDGVVPAMSVDGVAMSAGGGVGLPQTPVIWPAGMMQTLPLPEQQSDVAVHWPPVGTHVVAPQT